LAPGSISDFRVRGACVADDPGVAPATVKQLPGHAVHDEPGPHIRANPQIAMIGL